MPKKIALFDFCDTCVALQTGNIFLLGLIRGYGGYKAKLFAFILQARGIEYLLSRISRKFNKKLWLVKLCRGICAEDVRKWSTEFVKFLPHYSSAEILAEIDRLRNEGIEIVVISGGFKEYIELFFAERLGVTVIANEIDFTESLCSGSLAASDCMGQEKLERLRGYYNLLEGVEVVCAYSDCLSDLPILRLVPEHAFQVTLSMPNESVVTKIDLWGERING